MTEKYVEVSGKSDSSKPPEEEEVGIRNLKLLYRNPPHPERDKSSGASSDEETTSSSLIPIPDTLRHMRNELKRTISDIGENSEVESSSITMHNAAEENTDKVRNSLDELRKIYTLKNEASVAIKMNSANLMLDDILSSSANLNIPTNDNRNSRFYKEQENRTKSETETTTESSSSSENNCTHGQLPPLVAHTIPPIAFTFPQPPCASHCNNYHAVCTCPSSLEKGVLEKDQEESPRKKSFFGKLQNLQLKHKIMCVYKMMQKSPFGKERSNYEQGGEGGDSRSSCEEESGDNNGSRVCNCESDEKLYPKKMIFDLVESSDVSQADHRADHRANHRADHRTDHRADHRTDHRADHRADNRADHRADHRVEHRIEHRVEHKTDHRADHRVDYRIEHRADQSCKHKSENLKKKCTCPIEVNFNPMNTIKNSFANLEMNHQEGSFLGRKEFIQKECTCPIQVEFMGQCDRKNLNRRKWTVVKRREKGCMTLKECTCPNQKSNNSFPSLKDCTCPSQKESSCKSLKECTCLSQKESSCKNLRECIYLDHKESSNKNLKECTCLAVKKADSINVKECTCPEVIPQCICYKCTCKIHAATSTSIPCFKKSSDLKSLLRTDERPQVDNTTSVTPLAEPEAKQEDVKDVSEQAVDGSEIHTERKVVETETISKPSGGVKGWKKKCTQRKQIFEKTDIYYFDHGNSAYYRTTDHHPTRYTECLVERTDEYATKFWAEIFGVIAIGLSFIISFVIQFCRFILTSIVRSLTVGLLQIFSDYFFKPLLTIVFNGLIQPCLILIYNMATSVRDLCLPVSQIFGFFTKEIAHIFRAFRLIEINNDNYRQPICNCGNKV